MKNRNYNINESSEVLPYVKDSPIVLKTLDCSAKYNQDNNTITIKISNSDEFVCAASSFKWVEGYPQSFCLSYERCKNALKFLKNDDIISALQEIYKMPYAPYYVYLFNSDKNMLKGFTYILGQEKDENSERIEQFLTLTLQKDEEAEKLKKSDSKLYNLIKTRLENQILYLKCKCEVFFWFYQGLPQLTQFGLW
jgi:hypothetical protein